MARAAKKAKTATACERRFFYEGRKRTIDFVTTVTDDEAIDALGGFLAAGRNGEHAQAIGQSAIGVETKPWAVPCAFEAALRIINVKPETRLSAKFLKMRAPSKILDEANGCPFKIARHGTRSKYNGMWTITDQGEYPANEFYGRASDDGTWVPNSSTPQAVIDALTGK
jgi:hypothetical protein